jgi:excisionase family DNA binding protein
MSSKRWVSSEQLAEHLGVTSTTVMRWVADHRVPCLRAFRRTVRFCIAEVEAHVNRKGAAGKERSR